MAFVSRRMELALLNNLYGRSGAQFLILYVAVGSVKRP
jgi:hypothetical protein